MIILDTRTAEEIGREIARKIKPEEIEKMFKERRREEYKRGKKVMDDWSKLPSMDRPIGPPCGYSYLKWCDLVHEFANEENIAL